MVAIELEMAKAGFAPVTPPNEVSAGFASPIDAPVDDEPSRNLPEWLCSAAKIDEQSQEIRGSSWIIAVS